MNHKLFIGLLLSAALSLFPVTAHATVSNTTVSTTTAAGTGSTTNYTISFDFRANSQIVVTEYDTSTVPTSSANVPYGSGAGKFTITGGDPGTTVVMGTAPSTSQYLVITRNIPLTQPVVFSPASIFPYQGVSNQLDAMTLELQNLNASIGGSSGGSSGTSLPTGVANNFLGWNSSGASVVNIPNTAPSTGDVLQWGGSSWGLYSLTNSGLLTTINNGTTPVVGHSGGTGVNNNGTLTWGANSLAFTLSGSTSLTLPTSGTVLTGTANTGNVANTFATRDGSGNTSFNQLTANQFNGPVVGNVTGDVTGNTSGTSSNVTGTIAIGHGGTGQTTRQAALNALTGTQTNNYVLRSDGSNSALGALTTSDLPAAIPRSKLAQDTANTLITNDSSGNMSVLTGASVGNVPTWDGIRWVSLPGSGGGGGIVAQGWYGTDSGAANAYVITPTTAMTSYVAGNIVSFIAGNANTAAATINVSGLGVVSLKAPSGAAAVRGDILASQMVTAVYDGSAFQMTSPQGLATSANTANAAVKRDNSNSFSASTITSSLVGNVTGNVTGNIVGSQSGGTVSATTITANSATVTGAIQEKQTADALNGGIVMYSTDGSKEYGMFVLNAGNFGIRDITGGESIFNAVNIYRGTGPASPLWGWDVTGADTNTTLASPAAPAAMDARNTSATTNNFSSYLFTNSNQQQSAAIEGVHLSHTTGQGRLSFLTNSGSGLAEAFRMGSDLSLNAYGALDMGSHKVTSVTDPTSAQDAATKNYVDSVASGLQPKEAVYAASTANIAGTYANGVACVGATFTVTATGALSLDGATPPAGSRVLLKDQSSGLQNGVYDVTVAGALGISPILTRSLDYNTASDMNAGDLIPVTNGTANAITSWLQTSTISTCGTDSLTFTEWSYNPANFLLKASNLSDVANGQTSFNNISGMTLLGDIIYGGASGTRTVLAGNTSSTKKFLSQTGNGSVSAAPAWGQPACSDLSNAATSCSTDATNATNISSGNLALARLPSAVTWPSSGTVESFTPANHAVMLSGSGAAGTTAAPGATTGVALVSNGSSSDPSFTTVSVGGGGTGITSGTSGGVPYFSGSTTMASSAALTAHGVVVGGGAGTAPTSTSAGTSGYVLTSNGASADPTFQAAAGANSSYLLSNLGISASVGSSTLTVKLVQADGSTDPASGASTVQIGFRSSTATSGAYNIRSITAALQVAAPNGASLGQTAAINQYVWVYALDDAGTVDLCLSGVKFFNPDANQSSTAISSGATSGSTLYCTSSHSGAKPIRFLGRLLSSQTTAGTWATAMADVQITPTVTYTATDMASDSNWTVNGAGTVANKSCFSWRSGHMNHVTCDWTNGTCSGTVSLSPPSGQAIDSATPGLPTNSSLTVIGHGTQIITGTSRGVFSSDDEVNVVYDATDSTTNNKIFFAPNAGSSAYTPMSCSSSRLFSVKFEYPVKGWSAYGP